MILEKNTAWAVMMQQGQNVERYIQKQKRRLEEVKCEEGWYLWQSCEAALGQYNERFLNSDFSTRLYCFVSCVVL